MINLQNVTKVYGSNQSQVHALRGIDLNIEKGEMIGIVGKSGSGKSTLLNILGGLDRCSGGTYTFNSERISDFNNTQLADFRCSHIGFVVQNFALIDDMTVSENIALPLKYSGKAKSKISQAVRNILIKLELQDKEKAYPTELSGGQCQRVAIARALISNPSLILADEPTGALDEETGNLIINMFKQLNAEGITIIIVTHDMGIADTCKRIIRLKDGITVD